MRFGVAAGLVCLSLLGVSAGQQSSAAMNVPKPTNIPAQSLGSALEALARQREIQVIYRSDLVSNLQSAGAVGTFTPDEALKKLLAGTGLTYRYLNETTVTIAQAPPGSAASETPSSSLTVAPTASAAANDESRNGNRSIWERFLVAQANQGQTAGAATVENKRAQAGESQPAVLEEVIVTAQKREERLQDVPISISAVTSAEIAARNVTGLNDLQFSIPGLTISGPPGEQYISIRGVSNETGSALVGEYLDEMAINADKVQLGATGSLLDVRLLDMARVEVLRGPQGTLYGQGSEGGTIRYVTNSPDLTAYSGSAEGQLGRISSGGDSYKANGVLNLPVIQEKLGLRLVAGYERDGGWIDDSATGRANINAIAYKTFRGKLLARPVDPLELSLLYLHQDIDQDFQPRAINGVNPSPVQTSLHDAYDLVNGIAKYALGSVNLLETFGYLNRTIRLQSDLTNAFLPFLEAPPPFGFGLPAGFITQIPIHEPSKQRVLTDELRFSSSGQERVTWTTGVYWRRADAHIDYQTSTFPGQLPFTLLEIAQTTRSNSYAVFGDVGYKLTDRLTADIGARYFRDRLDVNANNVIFGFGTAITPPQATFHSVDPKFNLRYEFSAYSMVYLNAAKGFRSGGVNGAAHGAGIPFSYEPDELWNYEIGTKQQLLDRKLEIDVDVYRTNWTNVQVPVNLPPSNTAITENSGKVTGWGTDVSIVGRPLAGLTLTGTVGWNNLAYASVSPFTSGPLVGDPPDDTVRRSYSASLDYRRPVFARTVGFFRADYQYAGRAQETQGPILVGIPAHDLTNVRLGLAFERIEASIFSANVFNDRTVVFPPAFGNLANVERAPREVGVNVRAHF
jgi:outer membrane receptor protein involved in Fe transport